MKVPGFLLAGLLLTPSGTWAGPVDLSPPSHQFESVSPEGCLLIWREIASVDFGKGLVLPLRIGFFSKDGIVSPYLGKNWTCPVLEAKAQLIREDMMEVGLLCGKKLYLDRSQRDRNQFRSRDYQWNGELKDGVFRVFREDGWHLLFKDGDIQELRTDQGRVLSWIWQGKSVRRIQEKTSDQTFQVVFDSSHALAQAMLVNGKEYSFHFTRSSHELGPVHSLSRILSPDGNGESYTQSTIGHQIRELVVAVGTSVGTRYTYDISTGHILTNGDWAYQVRRGERGEEAPRILRTDKHGNSETYHFDPANSIATLEAADGTIAKRYLVTQPGPSYSLLAKEEVIANGKQTTTYRATYDDRGQLIHQVRQVDGRDVTTAYEYDKHGNRARAYQDGRLVWQAKYDPQGRVSELEHPGQSRVAYRYRDSGEYDEVITLVNEQLATVYKYAADGSLLGSQYPSPSQLRKAFGEAANAKNK